MDGAMVEIELRLPANHIRVRGEVIFSNVPGNLQRPNLPMGMGIRFAGVSKAEITLIADYVKNRLGELNV
jgi:hypothetical protein